MAADPTWGRGGGEKQYVLLTYFLAIDHIPYNHSRLALAGWGGGDKEGHQSMVWVGRVGGMLDASGLEHLVKDGPPLPLWTNICENITFALRT